MRVVLFLISLVWQINTQNVFEKNEYPLTYLNIFHVKTNSFFAKRLILSGGSDSLNIEETKRRLRSLGIFREVKTQRRKDTVFLNLHDAFTQSLFFDYKFYDTLKNIGVGFEDDNFLGTLSKVHVYYFKKYDRDYLQGGLSIPGLPLKSTDFTASFERGENLKKDMLMLNPFSTPLIKKYINALYIKEKKDEFLYQKGYIIDTNKIDFSLFSLKMGKPVKKKYTFLPYIATEYLKTRDTVFTRIGAGIYYVRLRSLKTRLMRSSLYNDYLTKGTVARFELYPLLRGVERLSLYLNLKEGMPPAYFDGSLIYSISRGSGYARLKNKIYLRLPWRFTVFGYTDFGIIHKVETVLSYENISVFSLGADNGLYAYPPHYFNGREMALIYGEIRLFGPSYKKLLGPQVALFYALGNAGEHIKYLSRSFGFSLRAEIGVLGPNAIYALNFGFKKPFESPLISFGTTLDFQ